jgi:hypothetical protein
MTECCLHQKTVSHVCADGAEDGEESCEWASGLAVVEAIRGGDPVALFQAEGIRCGAAFRVMKREFERGMGSPGGI